LAGVSGIGNEVFVRKLDRVGLFDKLLDVMPGVWRDVDEPSPINRAVGFEELQNRVRVKVAFGWLPVVAKRTESVIEQEVIVECDQANWLGSPFKLHDLVDELGVVCEAGPFKPVLCDFGEEIVKIVADGEELALSLWVLISFVLEGLEFLFKASAVLRLAQTKEDGM